MKLINRRTVVGLTALAVVLTFGASANAQLVPLNKCAAAKTGCMIGKVKGLLGCHQKAEGKGLPLDTAPGGCVDKIMIKFAACIAKKEEKPPCLTTGDAGSLEAAIDAYVLDVVQELDPGYPVPVLNKCSVCKKKVTGAKTAAKLGCLKKAFGKGLTVDTVCLSKAETKFAASFAKCETKPPCLTTGDAAALEAKVDAFYSDSVTDLSVGGGGGCGNGVLDGGEQCDPAGGPATSCETLQNTGAGFCNGSCQCACPTKVTFVGDAANPATSLDTGWTGISHASPTITNGDVTVAVSGCAGTSRPCGQCNVSGPIANPNAGAGQLDSQRCTNDTSIRCTSNAPCTGGGGTCQFFFGTYLSLAAGGVSTCVGNQFNGSVTGTANIESGEGVTSAFLTARVYNGIAIDNPCPRCVGDGAINDGTLGGTCDGGPRVGLTCDSNGTVPSRPDFGATSLDCPPNPAGILATLPIDLSNATDPVTRTVTTSSPTCGDGSGERCLCDTCNNAAATPCQSNADCVAVGATVCGGKRCLGGTNNGAACTNSSACPGGGICNRAGEPSKPSACLDDTTTVGVLDCTDTGSGEGACDQGPVTQTCSAASGHGQRACGSDLDCAPGGPGSCVAANRPCFLTGSDTGNGKVGTTTLVAVGMEDAPMNDSSSPTLAAVFCVGPTTSSSVNAVAGLPGPGRITLKGTAVGQP